MCKINIPSEARTIINCLNQCGFEAYVVGGCVRDTLLGIEPHDWDICTSAEPEQAKRALCSINGVNIIETGLKHGTITVIAKGGNYEVTTFRKDGDYADLRHPDSVEFITNVREDLSRRDFTINAMAYSDDTGVIDCFGGIEDLRNGVIACVGCPDERFSEDALRILRALRFASTFGFKISGDTALSIHQNKGGLCNVAAERIQSELCKLLCGSGALQALLNFHDVFSLIIPELKPCVGFEQNNQYHQYTVYDHIAHAVGNYKGNDTSINMALLLHDIGKPLCYTEDKNGGHFHGHAVPSKDIAEVVMNRLRFDNKTKTEVLELVLYHDATIEPNFKTVRRWLNKIGEHRFRQLLDVRMADILAHAEGTQESRIERRQSLKDIMALVLEERQCFSIKDLALRGSDVLSMGVPEGKVVGDALRHVLNLVINGEIENEIEAQKAEVRRYLNKSKDGVV